MVKRSTFHHGNLRHALVVAAMAEIERDGVEALSLRGIAEKVGVSKSAPYRHFGSKQELIDAVMALLLDELAAAYEVIPSELPPKSRLARACASYIAHIDEHPRISRLLPLHYASRKTSSADLPPIHAALVLFRGMVAASMPGAGEQEIDATTVAFLSALYGFAMLRSEGVMQRVPNFDLPVHPVLDRILSMASGNDCPSPPPRKTAAATALGVGGERR